MANFVYGHPNKGADDYLELFRQQASSANRIIFGVAVSLVLGWLSIIEVTHTKFGSLVETAGKLEGRLSAQKAELKSQLERLVRLEKLTIERKDLIVAEADWNVAQFKSVQVSGILVSMFTQKGKASFNIYLNEAKELDEKINEFSSETTLDVLGTKISLQRIFWGTAWTVIYSWLIIFIFSKRSSIAKTLAKSVHLYSNGNAKTKLGKARFMDIAGQVPIWIAPIRTINFGLASELRDRSDYSSEFRDALGWDSGDEKKAFLLTVLIVAFLSLIQFRIIWITYLITDSDPVAVIASNTGIFLRLFLDVLSSAAFLLTCAFIYVWFSGRHISVGGDFSPDKRQALVIAGYSVLVVGLTVAFRSGVNWSQSVGRNSARATNYAAAIGNNLRRKKLAAPSTPSRPWGFYAEFYDAGAVENATVHLILVNGQVRNVALFNSNIRIQVVDPVAVVNGISRFGGTWAIEAATIEYLKNDKLQSAIALLDAAVNRELSNNPVDATGSISYRLFDLLATLYARKGQYDKLEDLAERVDFAARNVFRESLEETLQDRVKRWKDKNGKWRRVRSNPDAIVKWSWSKHEAANTTDPTDKLRFRDDFVIEMS